MRSGQELFEELMIKQSLLDRSLSELGKRGRGKAQAEMEYRIGLAQEQLRLRDQGYPATLIGDLARGNKEIATLKMKRDIADVDYTANLEAINAYKLNIRVLDEQIKREWKG